MNSGELHAWHYATGQPVRVAWRDGQITALVEVTEKPDKELWIAPSLIDLQINGYAGVDFQQDGVSAEELLRAARGLRRDGCAHFLLTLITDDWSRLLARLKHFKRLRDESPELREAIIGWHIEGPFLSEKPGFHGAHNPALMRDPKPEDIRELRAVTGDDRMLITVAPERNGALEAIALARSLGIRVSLGHTDASAEILQRAVTAGATGFTHLANGCPRELDRHDNILWRVCETPGLTVSFIPDGHHVSPAPFRLLHKLLMARDEFLMTNDEGRKNFQTPGSSVPPAAPTPFVIRRSSLEIPAYYTTDAMAAAGAGPGRYRIGELEAEVGADQIVRQPGKTNFAGSALTPIEGVFRAAKLLDCPWQECWRRFSKMPAQFMGFENELRVGTKSFCLINPAAQKLVVVSPG